MIFKINNIWLHIKKKTKSNNKWKNSHNEAIQINSLKKGRLLHI